MNLPIAVLAATFVAACSPLGVEEFADTAPELRPERFFTGRTESFGVVEARSGEPLRALRTVTFGRPTEGGLEIDQTLAFADGETRRRRWRLVREANGAYRATASDILGESVGLARGRAFRMEYELQLEPGSRWRTAHAVHWMYLQDDGETLLNRVTLSRFGVVIATVAETFRRLPPG